MAPRRAAKQANHQPQPPPRNSATLFVMVFGVVTLFTLAVAALLAFTGGQGSAPTRTAPVSGPPAPTDACRALPAFTRDPALNLTGALALATDRQEKGLVMVSSERPPYQHPSWGDAGFLGAIAYDQGGNVYVAPTPRLSLVDNPLAGATTIWRVDSTSGVMRPFVALPGAASERNPFGVLGLTYVCGLDRIYAGNVIGSTPTTEAGGIVAFDLKTQGRTTILADVDVLGVLVVRAGSGYEVYAGLARSPAIIAVPLDAQGNRVGEVRTLLDLTTAGVAPSERARKLRFVNNELIVDVVPFNYSLQTSASNISQNRRAIWGYDLLTNSWTVRQQATTGQ
jgi:hypothetical protein